jgi:hypothetical protein
VITVYADINEPSAVHLDVTNQSQNDLNVRIKKIENTVISGSDNTFCWAGTCLPPTSYESKSMTITAGATISDFYGDYNANGILGLTSVTYVFLTNIPDDTAAVTINYIGSGTSVNNLNNETSFFRSYPNPANKEINIQSTVHSPQSTVLRIYNIYGTFISQYSVLSSQFSINTSEFPSGIYTYTLLSDKRRISSGKIIINH